MELGNFMSRARPRRRKPKPIRRKLKIKKQPLVVNLNNLGKKHKLILSKTIPKKTPKLAIVKVKKRKAMGSKQLRKVKIMLGAVLVLTIVMLYSYYLTTQGC